MPGARSRNFTFRFVDYSGADGLFRKYRLVVVDAKPYACHMAIAEEWKVWYLNADMALSVSNRVEEAAFMEFFDEDFAIRHGAALAAMSDRIGLELFHRRLRAKPLPAHCWFLKPTTPLPSFTTWTRQPSIPISFRRLRKIFHAFAGHAALSPFSRRQIKRGVMADDLPPRP